MKKKLSNLLYAIPIVVASFLPIKEAKSQPNKIYDLNTISLIFQVGDLGAGIRYDRIFPNLYPFGAYTSISKGFESDYYIKDHFKFSLGIMRYQKGSYFKDIKGFYGAGFSYHTYGKNKDEYEQLDRKELYKSISLDLIGGVRRGRLRFFIDIDPFKEHGSLGTGFSFGGSPKSKRICKVYPK